MSSVSSGSHSLAFRVMRLCRPSLAVDLSLRLDPLDFSLPEDEITDTEPDPASEEGWWRRNAVKDPIDMMGLSGLMVLPQTFGSIYLGETFCSYISVGNGTNHDVRDVGIKAELQTERQRVVLVDNTKTPMDYIRSGGRYDFIIEHDIKELGAHTLVCMAVYTDADGERKYLPQYFKFMASNPLSVRTKTAKKLTPRSQEEKFADCFTVTQVRTVKDSTFLEACIENSTKSHLFLDSVRFEPAPPLTVTEVEVGRDNGGSSEGPLSGLFKEFKLLKAIGGIRHFLYQLKRPKVDPASAKVDGRNTLGKLEILWRTTLGEAGRLQTQQILGNPITQKEVDLQIAELPSRIILERPFLVRVCVRNHTDRHVGPLKITMSQEDDQGATRAVVVNGLWSLVVPVVEPYGSTDFNLTLVATTIGVQWISGITVTDIREGKPYDSLTATEVFVEPA